MKLKKTRLERTCSNCKKTINKGERYGQKSKSEVVWETSWTIDKRPIKEIPAWAWRKVYFPIKSDWCEFCSEEQVA